MSDSGSIRVQSIAPGTTVAGRYEIVRTIGTGGMGTVYLAEDKALAMQVAIKVLHRAHGETRSHVERFIREVELMEKVDHPNVVKTFDFGTYEGMIYFTMEFVPGRSLADLLEQRDELPPLGDLILEICEGLSAIHAADIIHRDLKPANILIADDGSVKITDFGVARPLNSRLTLRGQKVGSVFYMAPEIWLGRELTPAVDFYALGVMLYEIVTGGPPFDTERPSEMMELHVKESPRRPKELNADIPDWLDILIVMLLSKSPKERPNTTEKVKRYIGRHSPDSTSRNKIASVDPLMAKARSQSTNQLVRIDPASGLPMPHRRSATVVLELTATRSQDEEDRDRGHSLPHKRGRTVILSLPRGAAVVLEIEYPSRDFLYFGIFFASLQVLDGLLTSIGMSRVGIVGEANPFLRHLMHHMGPEQALVLIKTLSVLVVVFLTVLAKRMVWIKNLIGALSCLYLFAAIIPWCYLLFYRHHLGY